MEKTIKKGLKKAIFESEIPHDILHYLDEGLVTVNDIVEVTFGTPRPGEDY